MAEEQGLSGLRIIRGILSFLRWILLLSLGTLVVIFVGEFILNFLFVGSAKLNQLLVVRFVRGVAEPVIDGIVSIIRFKTKVHDVELMPLIIATLLYFVTTFLSRQALQLIALVDAEEQLRQVRFRRAENKSMDGLTFSSTSTDKEIRGFWGRFLRRKEEERDRLLREFAEAKARLEKTKKRLVFLSVDIVGSTRIKVGQDPLLSERLFRDYRRLLEDIFKKYRYRTASWTPDGVMVCFTQLDLACGAARDLLGKLPGFNKEKNPLDFMIQVRCGVNAGEVYYDEKSPLELLSDRVLDITGHLQKAARPDSLLITEESYQQLREKKGFTPNERDVDGYKVFEWCIPSLASTSTSTSSAEIAK